MSKHEKITAPITDADLLRRTEQAILTHMAQNEGRMPTVSQVNEEVGTSFSRLCPAVRQVKERLLATQTRLASMPDIPEELRLAHEQALKDMWARTRELQNGEIVDLRRSQDATNAAHRQDIAETQAIITQIEAERNQHHARADAAEALAEARRCELEKLQAALAASLARLEERDSILALFAGGQASVAEGKQDLMSGRRNRKSDDPETGDLPMKSPGSSSSHPG